MRDEEKTKEQLIDEIAKLRQRNIELELAQKTQDNNSGLNELLSPNRWFFTGRSELFVSNKAKQQVSTCPTKYKFSDLVDVSILQQLLNSFYEATGIPYGLHDGDNNIISGKGWQDICTKFHRVCPQTECRCKQSDRYIFTHLHDQPYVGYKCMNGLMDFGTPIIVEGQQLASIFLGQLLNELPDEEYFCRQAEEYDFDKAAYMEALSRVPIIPEEQVNAIMRFYSQLGQFLATMGLERKRQLEEAGKAVKAQQERLNLVWEMSNNCFWDWDMEKDQIFISPYMTEMIGYLPEEFKTSRYPFRKIIHPDDLTLTIDSLSEYINGRTARYEVEYRVLTKFGEEKWILDHGQVVIRNKNGRPLRMVGTMIDITTRKQAEAALFQSETKFSTAFHSNPDPMAICALRDGRYVEVNDAFEKVSGFNRDEVIGHTLYELDFLAVPEQLDYLIKQIQDHGRIRGLELEIRLKSGEIRTFYLSGEIINIDGEPLLLHSSTDITESKRMVEALRFSEECFSKAFNASPVLMAVSSLNEGRIIMVNNAFCHVLGYNYEELIGRTVKEIGFWVDLAECYQIKECLMEKQPIREMEIKFRKKTGEERLGLYSAEYLDVDGEPCVLGVLTDITDLRQLEIEMARMDRLNLVGEMAASIGHEIRNPMTTVRGYLQLLGEKADYIQLKDCFNLMIEELDRANLIITEFLSLAKNKMVELKAKNLNAIIRNSLPLIQAKALSQDKYIKLELGELPELLLDKDEICQLIVNVVNNGLESMSLHGEVTIRTFMEYGTVVLAIQDQGHGIDRELMDKVGTPFFTTKEQGTGLGLAVCYRIAHRHNAKINIETGNAGTTFYVRFPIPIVS